MPRRYKTLIAEIDDKEYDVAVLGAGLAGSLTAFFLLKEDHKVLLIEAGDQILPDSCTSLNECYKLHTGPHYIGHPPTARQCLQDAILFARYFPDCIIGKVGDPWRRGRHYVMSNSLFSTDHIIRECQKLEAFYRAKVKEDPENEVFGSPNDFLKILEPSSLSANITREIPFTSEDGSDGGKVHVVKIIETPESQLDIFRLRAILQNKIHSHKNATVLLKHRVKDVIPKQLMRYMIKTQMANGAEKMILAVRSVVNCTWAGIERINKQLGYYHSEDKTLTRVKASVAVTLPPSLYNENTGTFFVGPFCSFTNLESRRYSDGKHHAIVTYEPDTNIGSFPAHKKGAKKYRKYFDSSEAGCCAQHRLAEDIVKGASRYYPDLASAEIERFQIGYVKMFNCPPDALSLYEATSPIHQRIEAGVDSHDHKGYVTNAAMKMVYGVGNAQIITCYLTSYLERERYTYHRLVFLRGLLQELFITDLFNGKDRTPKGNGFFRFFPPNHDAHSSRDDSILRRQITYAQEP